LNNREHGGRDQTFERRVQFSQGRAIAVGEGSREASAGAISRFHNGHPVDAAHHASSTRGLHIELAMGAGPLRFTHAARTEVGWGLADTVAVALAVEGRGADLRRRAGEWVRARVVLEPHRHILEALLIKRRRQILGETAVDSIVCGDERNCGRTACFLRTFGRPKRTLDIGEEAVRSIDDP